MFRCAASSISRLSLNLMGLGLTLATFTLPAAEITVTSSADNTTADGQVTLREAIQAANTDTSVDGSTAGSGADTIVFDASLAGGTIGLTVVGDTTFEESALLISSDITIEGDSTQGITIERGGATELRLFYVAAPNGDLTLRDLTLQGGLSRGDNGNQSGGGGRGGGGAGLGGAIYNANTLVIERCTLTDNEAIGGLTGVYVPGSTSGSMGGGPNGGAGGSFGNPNGTDGGPGGFGSAGGGGGNGFGGIAGDGGDGGFGGGGGGGGGNSGGGGTPGTGGTAGFGGVNGSNGTSNLGGAGGAGAGFGGAIYNDDGSVTIENSTFSANSADGGTSGADGLGGGVFSRNGYVSLDSCTFTGNTAAEGGGAVFVVGDATTSLYSVTNSILANSTATTDFEAQAINGGTVGSLSTNTGNLIEVQSGFTGTIVSTSDPMLGALADNGGPTQTHLPQAGSPAINSGDTTEIIKSGLEVDQRGSSRIVDGGVDIGAVETDAATPTIITVTSAADNTTADGLVTLREAIEAANTDTSVDGSTAGGAVDVIRFDSSLAGSVIALNTVGSTLFEEAAFEIVGNIRIEGLTTTGITISRDLGAAEMRLFDVPEGAVLTLTDLTLADGLARGDDGSVSGGGGRGGGGAGLGGAINNNGTLILSGVTLTANQAIGGEGGPYSPGSTNGSQGGGPNGGAGGAFGNPNGTDGIAGGFGSGGGGGGNGFGGIAGDGADGGIGGGGGGGGGNSGGGGTPGTGGTGGYGAADGQNGTSNLGGAGGAGAGLGGAIFNRGAIMMTNCTISGNSAAGGGTGAEGLGGGVFNYNGVVETLNCTFNDNEADDGGGFFNYASGFLVSARAELNNTIVANSVGATNDFIGVGNPPLSGTSVTSGVGNLIVWQTGFSGTIAVGSDPNLAPLADNGGPTQTHALPYGSPAIDQGDDTAANDAGLIADQRGETRILDGAVDIGAYESAFPQADIPLATIDFPPQDVDSGPSSPVALIITNTGSADLTISSVSFLTNDPGEFAISSDTGEGTVAPAAARTLEIVFDPTVNGPQTTQLRIETDDPDGSITDIRLSGLGIHSDPDPALGGCDPAVTFPSAGVPIPITAGPASVTATVTVSGLGTYLWDINVLTDIDFGQPGDLDFTLESPAGTIVTLSTDNGLMFDGAFAGTLWDDQADPNGQVPYPSSGGNEGLVTDTYYLTSTLEESLVPEEALGAFIGEDPNGTWTFKLTNVNVLTGSIDDLQLIIMACSTAPTTHSYSAANSSPETIISSSPVVISSEIAVSGTEGVICDVDVVTAITHTWNSDLDITLMSPAGTVVTLTTDNGGGNDDGFNGTVWNDSANPGGALPYTTNDGLVTDSLYVNGVAQPTLVPEEALAAFNGESADGAWVLTISDDATADGGILASWALDITTCDALSPNVTVDQTSLNFGDQDIDDGATAPQVVTIENTGAGALTFTGAGIAIVNAAASDFGFAVPVDVSPLASGATRAVSIVFDPNTVGVKGPVLRITTDDPDEPTLDVALSGRGVDQEIAVTPLSLNFGPQRVEDGASGVLSVTISNAGTADLNFTGAFAITGSEAADFAITNSPAVTPLTPGSDRTVDVVIDPSANGARSAVLEINTDDADESLVQVTLTGTGFSGLVTDPQDVVGYLLGLYGEPASPERLYDTNSDSRIDAADVVTNVP